MSIEENKQVIRNYVNEVINDHDLDKLPEYVDQNALDHAAPPGFPGGPAGARAFLGMFFTAFPDVHYEIDDLIADEDKVTIRATLSGSHSGPFMGMPPTGRNFSIQGIETLRLKDGKYVEHWGGIDDVGLMSQLGLMGMPGGDGQGGGDQGGQGGQGGWQG
jgi:predicted ester cyclase